MIQRNPVNEHHMTLMERMRVLSEGTKYDSCNQSAVCHAFGPDGRCIQLYKTLMTNSCSGECTYCPNRCGRDSVRASLSPEEIVKITWSFYRRNAIEGLFLSSGVMGDSERTAEKQLEVARLLRGQGFTGYIHIRVMPGTPKYLLEEIADCANKFGVNAETTSSLNYSEICPNFDYQNDVLQRLQWTRDLINKKRRDAGSRGRIIGANDTQFVVGALQESDREIIGTVEKFMDQYELRRPYFMSFDPVPFTPLENNEPSPQWRETRLYQTSYLLKDYGLTANDLDHVLDDNGFLCNADPKMLLASCRPDMFPVDINSASRDELLTVPGIGPVGANRIMQSRPIASEKELSRMGIVLARARPFISINGKKQTNLFSFAGVGA
ncbi:radical SAM protein [Methanolobus mangrovi]|uniref:Radical SAM protein n=1 Tax=Methanolobus mangrovi TaxID=3072977 RepID=A0AA51UEQ4_9EURY|nr:radical SAM protein [Methanolobus mangrovi]WMW21854.1 radical SAM protein [Methanolobus mangrovi]